MNGSGSPSAMISEMDELAILFAAMRLDDDTAAAGAYTPPQNAHTHAAAPPPAFSAAMDALTRQFEALTLEEDEAAALAVKFAALDISDGTGMVWSPLFGTVQLAVQGHAPAPQAVPKPAHANAPGAQQANAYVPGQPSGSGTPASSSQSTAPPMNGGIGGASKALSRAT